MPKEIKINKKKFVQLYIMNELSDEPKNAAGLASELGVSRTYYYSLLDKLRDEIDKARVHIEKQLYQDAVKALRRKLAAKDVSLETIAFALRVSRTELQQEKNEQIGVPAGGGGVVVILPPLVPLENSGNGNGNGNGNGK